MFVLSQPRLKLRPRIASIVLLALIYYATAEISRHVAATPQSVTPVWAPDGFATAAILILGYQILPGILIGSFLANIWAFFNPDTLYTAIISILQVLGIAIGTAGGAVVGNYLLRQTIKGRNPFKRLNDVYAFLGLTGALAPTINSTVGVLCLCLCGKVPWAMFGTVWLTWWISNVSGICIFTPALLSWYEFFFKTFKKRASSPSDYKTESKQISRWRVTEVSILVVIVLGISFTSFYQEYGLEYVLIPCLVWTVIRFGQLGATNLIVVITMIAVLGTVRGLGTFASKDINQSLILLQSFIVVIIVTTLSLIAILSEKQQAIASLQNSKIRLTNKSIQLQESKAKLNENTIVLEKQNFALMEAKRVAEEANRTKSEFLSNMSHELRTPLNAILGLIQLLQDSTNLDFQEKADIQTIYQAGTHLLNLIDDILDISKIEAGKMELYLQNVYFSVFLKDLVEIMQVQANQKKIDFIYNFSTDLPEVIYTDEKRLKQILLNLLSNAVKFTKKGHVVFRVTSNKLAKLDTEDPETSDSFALIDFEIEDSGIGIDRDKLEFIFLPFEQAGETKFKVQGTGLGLAISQKIATMLGSQITVSSQRNVGTVFRFTVQLQIPETKILYKQNALIDNVSTVSNAPVLDQNLASKLPLKILLAEDNIVNQKVACKILNRLGYEVDIASDGLKVLAAMRDRVYDVILMDIQMPELDGIEATKHIVKNMDVNQRPYIIAMTANVMDSDRLIYTEAGMDDFVGKPVNVGLLVEALMRSQRVSQEI